MTPLVLLEHVELPASLNPPDDDSLFDSSVEERFPMLIFETGAHDVG